MYRFLRIAILIFVAAVLAFLARERVSQAFTGNTPGSNEIVQLAAQPVQQQPAAGEEQVASESQQEQSQFAAADGLIWNDLNRDGLQSVDEPGIQDVTVNLMTTSNAVAGTTFTDKNGAYRFKNLAPGDYYTVTLPAAGFVMSPRDQGVNELVDSDADLNTGETMAVTLIAGENGLVWTTGMYSPTAPVQPAPGTVRPPPTDIEVCDPGTYPLGGISRLEVRRLAEGYCVHAFLWNHAFAIGRIPGGAGRIVPEVVFVEVYYQGNFVYQYDVPGELDSILVCYAVPLEIPQSQIYFMDFYGPRFSERTGQPSWEPLATTIEDWVACAVAQTSGAYALIGK